MTWACKLQLHNSVTRSILRVLLRCKHSVAESYTKVWRMQDDQEETDYDSHNVAGGDSCVTEPQANSPSSSSFSSFSSSSSASPSSSHHEDSTRSTAAEVSLQLVLLMLRSEDNRHMRDCHATEPIHAGHAQVQQVTFCFEFSTCRKCRTAASGMAVCCDCSALRAPRVKLCICGNTTR